jgi:lysyl-tRNA synthetase, class II
MLNSTLLKAATYQDSAAVLELELCGGDIYEYFRVPTQVFQDLLQATSKGRYFNAYIRNRFRFRKVGVDRHELDREASPVTP